MILEKQNKISVKRKDGVEVIASLRKLELSDIDAVMALQKEVLDALVDAQIFVPSTKEEYSHMVKESGVALGYFTEEDGLIALGVYDKRGYSEGNYGYDLAFEGEKLLKVGQVDTVLVKAEYRGNGLQYKLCQAIEEVAKEQQTPILCATASPLNPYSVNTFIKLGYTIQLEKLKYGGLRRYVLMKVLA